MQRVIHYEKSSEKKLAGYCAMIAAFFLALCSRSSFLYSFNDWVDANGFLTMGKGILHGLVPYKNLYEQKGPILYFAHAVAALIPGKPFFGVYLLEILAFAAFLYIASKLIRLFLPTSHVYVILPLLAALLLSAESFCQGDSAEELLAPFVLYTLYSTIYYFMREYSAAMSYKMLFLNGIAAGIVLWVKYTLLGLHFAFMAVLFFVMLKDRRVKRAFISCVVFLAGMAVPTVIVLLYFGLNGAVGDLLRVYFYNNIFLYDSSAKMSMLGRLLTILLRIGDTFFRNLQFSVFTIIGVAVFALTPLFIKDAEGRIMILVEAVFLASFIYTGSNFAYYGYILCVFPVLGFIALGRLIEHTPNIFDLQILAKLRRILKGEDETIVEDRSKEDRVMRCVILGAYIAICMLFAFYKCPNTGAIGTEKADMAQFVFADIMKEEEDATLLNYGFLDGGFYTVSGILPTERFFQMQNISYEAMPEMMDEQDACVREGRVEFVVFRGESVPEFFSDNYEEVSEMRQRYEGSSMRYVLLKKR